jgi:iron complex outermembrane receptor protein
LAVEDPALRRSSQTKEAIKTMSKLPLLFFSLLLSFCLAFSLGARPAQAGETAKLPEMSVTATRSERELDKLPRNVTVITRDQIQALSPLTVTDVLKTVAGLTVRDYTGTGAWSSVDMRGFGETGALHTLVLVDGRRINQIDLSGVDFTTIPVENIERIEILRGPASVLYGDSAVGGVINIITRKGQGKPKAKLQGQYGSYGLWGLRGYAEGGLDKLGWFVSARHDYTDGYRQNSETRLRNFTFNTNYDAGQGWGFLLDGALNQIHYSLPGGLDATDYEQNRRQSNDPNDWGERKSGNIRGQVSKDWGAGGVLTTDLSFRRQENESALGGWHNAHRLTDINNWGVLPKYVLNHSIGGLNNRITLGVDYYYTAMDTDKYALSGPKTESIEYKVSTLGPYFLDEFSLTPALSLSFGGRYQQTDYDLSLKPVGEANSSKDYNDDQTAWTVGLTYTFLPGSKAYARVSRTFRYPTTEEYVTYGAFNQLDPEKGHNYEVGGEWTFMPGGRLSVACYLLQMEDEISYSKDTLTNENLDDTQHKGVEASLVVPVHKLLSLFGSLTYSENTFTAGPNDGKNIPLVPDWKAAAGLTLTLPQGFTGTLRLRYVGERPYGNDRDNEFPKMDSFITLDVNLNYVWKRYKFFLNANNLLGEKYCTWAYASQYGYSYYPEPEQVIWGGVGVNF